MTLYLWAETVTFSSTWKPTFSNVLIRDAVNFSFVKNMHGSRLISRFRLKSSKGSFTPSDSVSNVTLTGKKRVGNLFCRHSVRQIDQRCRPSMVTQSFGVNRPYGPINTKCQRQRCNYSATLRFCSHWNEWRRLKMGWKPPFWSVIVEL